MSELQKFFGTFQIFPGQGVRHIITGTYGVVHQTNDQERRVIIMENTGKELANQKPVPPRLAKVQFAGELQGVYRYEDLGPADMDQVDLEELQEKLEGYVETRGSRSFIPVNALESINMHAEYKVFTQRFESQAGPRKQIKIETRMDNGVVFTGGKCEHGVYITHERIEDDSLHCTICNPYFIMAKAGIEYKG